MKKFIVLIMIFFMSCPMISLAGNRHDMAGLEFQTAEGWAPLVEGFRLTLKRKDNNAILMVTHMPYHTQGKGLPGIKEFVEESGNGLLSRAVETEAVIYKFDRGRLKGYYFGLTDKAPKPGEFKYMKQGAVMSDRVYLIFTLLFNGSNDPSEKAFSMIASMKPSETKPANIFPMLIKPNEMPNGFRVSGMSSGGDPKCYSKQSISFYHEKVVDMFPQGDMDKQSFLKFKEEIKSALKMDFKYFQSFYDTEGRPATLLFMQFAQVENAIPFSEGLLWGKNNGPTRDHPERMFVKGNVIIILCVRPGEEGVYSWIMKKYR